MNLDWPHLEISMVAKANAFLSKELKKILDSQHFVLENSFSSFPAYWISKLNVFEYVYVSLQKEYLQEYIDPLSLKVNMVF